MRNPTFTRDKAKTAQGKKDKDLDRNHSPYKRETTIEILNVHNAKSAWSDRTRFAWADTETVSAACRPDKNAPAELTVAAK